jgi:hypothetical protein
LLSHDGYTVPPARGVDDHVHGVPFVHREGVHREEGVCIERRVSFEGLTFEGEQRGVEKITIVSTSIEF